MNQILIFSDNEAIIESWSTALSPLYQVGTTKTLDLIVNTNIVVIDAQKIDQDPSLFATFGTKSYRFLIVGNEWSEQNQIKALVHGAAGYCGQLEPAELLLQAIERVLIGEIWIQRSIIPKVIEKLLKAQQSTVNKVEEMPTKESSILLQTLSIRELDVARIISSGGSNKVIASKLFISERTVKAHLSSIFKKLKVPDRLHLALFIRQFN